MIDSNERKSGVKASRPSSARGLAGRPVLEGLEGRTMMSASLLSTHVTASPILSLPAAPISVPLGTGTFTLGSLGSPLRFPTPVPTPVTTTVPSNGPRIPKIILGNPTPTPVPLPIFHNPFPVQLDPIHTKYAQLGGASGFLGKALSKETPTFNGGLYERFQGGNIYYSKATGAHVVYGAILAEYQATANETDFYGNNVQKLLGLPTSDEQNVPGVAGARQNTFQGGGIYFSASTGAHAVYGSINARYAATGGPAGPLGLPTSEESGIPDGRVSYFQNGKIIFTADGNTRVVYAQSYQTFDTGPISFSNGVPVGGSVQLTIKQDGSYELSGHFHDSGATSYNVSLVFGVRSTSGVLYTFAHTGHLAGTFESGSRDDTFDIAGNSPKIAANWQDLEGATAACTTSTSMDLNPLVAQVEGAVGTVLAVVALLV